MILNKQNIVKKKPQNKQEDNFIAKNKKAFFDYEILESLEAGISLLGSEVKSLRARKVNLKDSFVRIVKGEAIVFGLHISLLATTNAYVRPDEKRPRTLLLHKKQINKLFGQVSVEGLSIVPTMMYFNKKGIAKLTIALVKGKNTHDKRLSLRQKTLDKEAKMAMSEKINHIRFK